MRGVRWRAVKVADASDEADTLASLAPMEHRSSRGLGTVDSVLTPAGDYFQFPEAMNGAQCAGWVERPSRRCRASSARLAA